MKYHKAILHTHILLAGVCTPFLILYMVTGILYTFGFKGDYVTTKEQLAPTVIDVSSPDKVREFLSSELQKRGRAIPAGAFNYKQSEGAWQATWVGSKGEHALKQTVDGGLELTMNDATLHRQLVQLHKAKGGTVFKVAAAIFTAFTLSLFALGLSLAMRTKGMRYEIAFGMGVGIFALFIAAVLS